MNICLVGTAPSSIRLAPYNNPEWEIWCCSPGTWATKPSRITQFFELHRWEPGQSWMSEEYCQFLLDFQGKVWTAESIEGMANCNVLPVDYLVDKYGPYFFTSTLAWMMAMAIEEKPDKIALYGVDMSATEEYGQQKQGCQYFALIARAKGIEVGTPPESDLLRPAPLYGVCEQSHAHIKMLARNRELLARAKGLQEKVDGSLRELMFVQGAIDDLKWVQDTWIGNTDFAGQKYVEPPLVPAVEELAEVVPLKKVDRDMTFTDEMSADDTGT